MLKEYILLLKAALRAFQSQFICSLQNHDLFYLCSKFLSLKMSIKRHLSKFTLKRNTEAFISFYINFTLLMAGITNSPQLLAKVGVKLFVMAMANRIQGNSSVSED